VRELFRVPRWPRWYCTYVLDHSGYLREVRKIDETSSEYVCRVCGWQGVRKRPAESVRAYF